MLKETMMVIFLSVFAAGCAGMQAQSYVMTTKRADIENKSGNSGYIAGKGQYQEPVRKTRKVYVLELTKPIPEGEVKKVEQEIQSAPQQAVAQAPAEATHQQPAAVQETTKRIVIPRIEDEPVAAVAETVKAEEIGPKEDQTYTVLKDDTLQKIAKKFYGSYGKWIKLYEANKAKLKNPNVVRPGTVLTIPAVGEKK